MNTLQNPQQNPAESLMAQGQQELQAYPPQSPEHKQGMIALGELAAEMGTPLPAAAPEALMEVPPGFSKVEKLPRPALLDAAQFVDKIRPLEHGVEYEVDITEYTTDAGYKIRVCDLRPYTANALRRSVPQRAAEQERLDTAVLRDLKIYADTGLPRNTVTGLSGVNYTKASTARAYWALVTAKGEDAGIRTIARVGDCGNKGNQVDLYRRLFGIKM